MVESMNKYPERQRYVYTIPTKKGNLVLRFQQATAEETKDYFSIIDRFSDGDVLIRYQATKDYEKY